MTPPEATATRTLILPVPVDAAMRRSGWLAVALLLALAAPGCTSFDPPASDAPAAASPADGALASASTLSRSGSTSVVPGPGAELMLSETWVKPRHAVQASARSPERDVDWSWFVATNTTSVDVVRVATLDYLRGGEWQAEPGRGRVSTGLLPPAAASPDIILGPREGIYEFRAPRHAAAIFALETVATASAEVVEVALVRDPLGFRFDPPSAVAAPGARVRFVNADAVPHSVQEREFLLRLPDREGAVELVGVETGWYVLAARARADDGGESWAQQALLVDFESPTSRADVGPYEGRFGPPSGMGARTYRFVAAHDVRELILALDVRATLAAMPAVVRATLQHEGQVLDVRDVDGRAEWRLADLPSGDYSVLLETGPDAVATYTLSGAMAYAPSPPEAPAWVHERLERSFDAPP